MQDSASVQSTTPTKIVRAAILVAALGYFVDVYDLILFTVVRIPSLKSLGVPATALLGTGADLSGIQMLGMLIGGILWGILGDKRGRLSVLFGSIFLYSAANIANGFVHSVETYWICRLIAGIGLAGELGAGITLVSEMMPKEKRGYGTMIVATVGVFGAVVAAIVGKTLNAADPVDGWRTAYFIGGGLGIALLLLRIGVAESGMFKNVRLSDVRRGSFFSLFTNWHRFLKFLCCILIGIPIWYGIGILVAFAPDFLKELHITTDVKPEVVVADAVIYFYLGVTGGDFASGFISQKLKNRKKVVFCFILATAASIAAYCLAQEVSLTMFYIICALLGFTGGYWAVMVAIASEQFGTNIRSTVSTSVPNFVRGMLQPMLILFTALRASVGLIGSAAIVGGITVTLALIGLSQLSETFGKDLDYVEDF